jgi:hypothetical protein
VYDEVLFLLVRYYVQNAFLDKAEKAMYIIIIGQLLRKNYYFDGLSEGFK